MLAAHQHEFEQSMYMAYMTESIRLMGENKVLKSSWLEMIEPRHRETRSAEDIVSDVIERGGLVVRG